MLIKVKSVKKKLNINQMLIISAKTLGQKKEEDGIVLPSIRYYCNLKAHPPLEALHIWPASH